MPKINWDDLLKSTPRFLVISGLVLVLWASLTTAGYRAVHVELESPARYVVLGLGGLLIVAGVVWLLVPARGEDVPIRTIQIDDVKTTGVAPNPKVEVSGHVTPVKKSVNVFILRENLADRSAGTFSLAKGYATTDDNGNWTHRVALWPPGPFQIYAVVTTRAYEDLFGFYRRVFDALPKEPGTHSVPGWPNLGELPKKKEVDHREYHLPS